MDGVSNNYDMSYKKIKLADENNINWKNIKNRKKKKKIWINFNNYNIFLIYNQ